MKLSLAWIFDHINADWKSQDIDLIVTKFNAVTAEIEKVHAVSIDLQPFFMAQLTQQTDQLYTLDIPELGRQITLSVRPQTQDLFEPKQGLCYLVKQRANDFIWATVADFGIDKGGLLPPFDVSPADLLGGWRRDFEHKDVIIEVDNKSITHRPDMWGHRGFAREIASFLDLPLKNEAEFLKPLPAMKFERDSEQTKTVPFVIHNQTSELCSKFVGLYFSAIEHKPSNIFLASRLLKIGARPHSCLVDITNYLMNDWSQPVHAYDAVKISGQKVVIRLAKAGEKLDLLDGSTITLTEHDLVIADDQKPMCLAGVKGGLHSGVGLNTTQIFLEAAHFDAANVRRTAQRHKIRTDSSARYEKTLDPEQTLQAPERFIKLLEQCGVKASYADEMIVIGKQVHETLIEVEHTFLQNRCGVSLQESDVINPLTRLGFKVVGSKNQRGDKVYMVNVPSFRSSKDIKIKEDILEEVIRSYGFERIPHNLPYFAQEPFTTTSTMRLRAIKRFFAYAARMTEQQNYAFHDEAFIAQLGLKPNHSVAVVNPVSENHYRMVDSLVPGLLKNIVHNHSGRDRLAFFECGRTWERLEQSVLERKILAGVIFDKRGIVDFYEGKQLLLDLFKLVGLSFSAMIWKKTSSVAAWYNKQQAAQVLYNNHVLGYVGKANAVMLAQLDLIQEADAFIFELDLDFLLNFEYSIKRMEKISKFQESSFDISILVPLNVTVDDLQHAFAAVDPLVYKVELIDFFEKEEWNNQRSLTFRFWMQHQERTLEKEDIDSAWKAAVALAQKHGATLRA